MKKVNKVIAYVFFAIAFALVIAAFFKGAYLFYEAIAYGVIGVCMIDTSEKEEEVK